MGVGVQSEASGEVAEHTRHSLDVYTILQCDGCKGMSQVVKPDLGNACSCQHSFQHIIVYCRSGRRSKIAAESLANLGYTNVKEFGGIIDWPYEIEK